VTLVILVQGFKSHCEPHVAYLTKLNNRPVNKVKLSRCLTNWGTRERSWLRRYATSLKVAGSSPDEVDFFN
jgi:hypothetical protein